MKLIRSWPRKVPVGRAYVFDTWPRLIMDEYDYTPLADLDDDILLIEWDIAVDRDGLDTFVTAALEQPDRVLVAPYKLYESTVHSHRLKKSVWAHRDVNGAHVTKGDPHCAMFGMGLIYMPKKAIRRFVDEHGGHFSDGAFSGWYANNICDQTPILWDVHAVHLHYAVNVDGFTPENHKPEPTPTWDESMTMTMSQVPEDHDDPIVAALLRERNMAVRRGRPALVAAIDEQLVIRDYRSKTDE